MLFVVFNLLLLLCQAGRNEELVLFPATVDGHLQYEIDKEQIVSSNTMIGHLCIKRDLPQSFVFPEGIEEISIVHKRIINDIYQYNSIADFIQAYDSNTYMVLGKTKDEELLHDLIYNLTGFDVVRFGKVNTQIYDPIDNVFHGINEQLEKPNGYFYTTHQLQKDYVSDFSIKSVFNLDFLNSINTNLESLRSGDIISRFKTQLYKNMKELRNEWKFEEDIIGKQFGMKLRINTKNQTYEYCESNIFNRQQLPMRYPSKEDSYNRNLYFMNTCGIDYFTNTKTCKFTRFTERGKESEMIDFGTVQYKDTMPMYLQTLQGEGSHLTESISLFNFNGTTKDEMYSVYTVPQGMFIDKYQCEEISRKERKIEVYMYEPMDLEAPILTGRQAHVIVKMKRPTENLVQISLPIHLRYHKASKTEPYEQDYSFPPPEVFFTCENNGNCTESKSLMLLKRIHKNNHHIPYSCSVTESNQYIHPKCEYQINKYLIPVGQLDSFDIVTKITLGTTLIGSLIIVLFLIIF